jgi:protein-L-isoaspartate O-methyltransferase
MITPVGSAQAQELQLVRREDRRAVITKLEGCRFVPLIGAAGFAPGK